MAAVTTYNCNAATEKKGGGKREIKKTLTLIFISLNYFCPFPPPFFLTQWCTIAGSFILKTKMAATIGLIYKLTTSKPNDFIVCVHIKKKASESCPYVKTGSEETE